MIRKAVEEICCAVLPDLFSRFSSANRADKPNLVRAAALMQGMAAIHRFHPADIRENVNVKTTSARELLSSFFGVEQTPKKPSEPPHVPSHDVIGVDVDTVRGTLDRANIKVNVKGLDRSVGVGKRLAFSLSPGDLPPGSEVNLYEEGGVAKYYEIVSPPLPAVEEIKRRVDAHQETLNQVPALRETLERSQAEKLAALQTEVRSELSQKDTQLNSLREDLRSQLHQKDQQIAEMQQQFQQRLTEVEARSTDIQGRLQLQITQKDEQLSNLQSTLQRLQTGHEDLIKAVSPQRLQDLQSQLDALRTQIQPRPPRGENRSGG
jgi:hypothetical protein